MHLVVYSNHMVFTRFSPILSTSFLFHCAHARSQTISLRFKIYVWQIISLNIVNLVLWSPSPLSPPLIHVFSNGILYTFIMVIYVNNMAQIRSMAKIARANLILETYTPVHIYLLFYGEMYQFSHIQFNRLLNRWIPFQVHFANIEIVQMRSQIFRFRREWFRWIYCI